MTDQANNSLALAQEKRLREQLSRMPAFAAPAGAAASSGNRLLRELGRRLAPRHGLARFRRETLDDRWEPILFSVLSLLLAWDLVRIIAYIFR